MYILLQTHTYALYTQTLTQIYITAMYLHNQIISIRVNYLIEIYKFIQNDMTEIIN